MKKSPLVRVRPRDPEQTRQRILTVATREFARAGFDGARVARITKLAKCNPRMLYHYFGSKEQLYLAVLDSAYAEIRARERHLDLDDGEPVETLRQLVLLTFDFFQSNETFVRLTRGENLLGGRFIRRSRMIKDMSQPLIASIAVLIERGLESRTFTRRIDPLQLYLSIVALSVHHINNVHTLSAVFGVDLTDATWQAERREHVCTTVLHLVGADAHDPSRLAKQGVSC